jgi:hypothetical protein
MTDTITVDVLRDKGLSVQVCANSDDETAVRDITNRVHPCGTDLGWTHADEPQNAPVPCADRVGFTHYIFHA